MDTRALGGDFLPRGEILTVEMKTVTQYTALIRLTAQMQEKERIPDRRERKWEKTARDHSLISITCMAFMWMGASESWCHIFPREVFEYVNIFYWFSRPPLPFKPLNYTVWHPGININKRDILVHPIIFYITVCHQQRFSRLFIIYCCFHWRCLSCYMRFWFFCKRILTVFPA